jgi:hypothetical protein
MAAVVRSHPVAGELLSEGIAEQSMWWPDPDTGVMLRCRPDWRHNNVIVDYKTSRSAYPYSFQREAERYGYHQQNAFYEGGVRALGLCDEPEFWFIAQEKTRPYPVTVARYARRAVDRGRSLNRQAIDLYAKCVADGDWPAYGDGVFEMDLSAWQYRDDDEEYFTYDD